MDKKRVTRGSSDSHSRKGSSKYVPGKRSPSPEIIRKYPPRRSPGAKRSLSPAKGRKASKSPRRDEKRRSKEDTKRKSSPSASPKVGRKKGQVSPKSAEKLELKTTGSTSSVSTQSTSKTLTLSTGADSDLKAAKVLSARMSQEPRTLTPASELSHRSVSRSVSQSVERFSHAEFSDNENDYGKDSSYDFGNDLAKSYIQRGKSLLLADKLVAAGNIGAAIYLILIPGLTLVLTYLCLTRGCPVKLPNWNQFQKLDTYINYELAGIYVSFTILSATLGSFPLGRIVNIFTERGENIYYFNGLATALITFIAICTAEYFKYPIVELIYKNLFQLCILAILNAFSLASCLYLRAKRTPEYLWNPQGKTGKTLVDFFLGREVTPLWFNRIDIKLVQNRISTILALTLAGIFFYKSIHFQPKKKLVEGEITFLEEVVSFVETIRFNEAGAVASGLLILYLLDVLLHEHHLTSSFDLQYEGVGGLLLTRYATFPFLISMLPKFILEQRVINPPRWILATVAVLFLAGVIVKRISNKIKYEYRLNPLHVKFDDIGTIPTHQNKRLIISGFWGVVRHPNYLGEIISLLSLLPLLYLKFSWIPAISVVYLIIFFCHRAIRVDDRNRTRYISAWTRYTTLVPKMVVPKVF